MAEILEEKKEERKRKSLKIEKMKAKSWRIKCQVKNQVKMKMTHQKVRRTELVENWKYLNCQVSIQSKRVKQKAMSWRERMILKCETKHRTETQMEFEARIQTVNEMGVN